MHHLGWHGVLPTKLGGLGVMNLDEFAMALSTLASASVVDSAKIWAAFGNPCFEEDMNIFYTAASITVGKRCKIPFWEAPWLCRRKSKRLPHSSLPSLEENLGGSTKLSKEKNA
jgi:hypothetical protein